MPRSEAQKKADKKYQNSEKCKYKTVGTRLHVDHISNIEVAAEKNGITISKFLALSALYCANNNIKFED